MARGRRCDMGCESWPDKQLYQHCLYCGEDTTPYTNLQPLSDEEALSILRKIQFEHYYERYCVQKGQPTTGPLEPC